MKEKILTLFSLGGYIDYNAIKALLEQDYSGENDILISTYNPHKLDEAYWGQNIVLKQNKAKDIILKGDYTHLFSVEADILLPPNALSKLLATDKDIICGLYRLHSHSGPLSKKLAIFRRIKEQSGYKSLEENIDFVPGQIIPVDFLPFGCTLIKRKVLCDIDFSIGLDVDFSRQCIEKEYELWADTSITCGHEDHYKKQ